MKTAKRKSAAVKKTTCELLGICTSSEKNRSVLVIMCGRQQDGALQRQLSSHVCDAATAKTVSKFPCNFLIKKTRDVLQGSAEQNLRCFKNYNVSWLKHLLHNSRWRKRHADYHQLKKRRLRNRRRTRFCFCAQIVSKCFYLASIGRQDSLWTVNVLARVVTRWNRACDQRLATQVSYTHSTVDTGHHCHAGDQVVNWRLGLVQAFFCGMLPGFKKVYVKWNVVLF